MSDRELKVNVYNSSKVGHANVSFYEGGEHVYTIGANIRLEVPQLAVPQVAPFEPDDGIYRNESADHIAAIVEGTITSASVPVTDLKYENLLTEARALEGQTFNYSVFTEACVELVEEFYEATGHPGEFGDLFPEVARNGSLVWQRVPITDSSPISTWPDDIPYYEPPPPSVPDPPLPPAPKIYGDMPPPPLPDLVDDGLEIDNGFSDASSEDGLTEPETTSASVSGGFPAISGNNVQLDFGPNMPAAHESWLPDEPLSYGDDLVAADDDFMKTASFGEPVADDHPSTTTLDAETGFGSNGADDDDGNDHDDPSPSSESTSPAADVNMRDPTPQPETIADDIGPDVTDDFEFAESNALTDLSFGDDFDDLSTVDSQSVSDVELSFGSYDDEFAYDGGYDISAGNYDNFDYGI